MKRPTLKTPERTVEEDERLSMMKTRLEAERPLLTDATLEFWGERFVEKAVEELAGCTFEGYLRRPLYYERIANARREVAWRTGRPFGIETPAEK